MIAKQTIGKSFTGALKYNQKKLNHQDPKQRAEVLSTNFNSLNPQDIRKELAVMKAMNPKLKRNTYHASLNFSKNEQISDHKMQKIAEEYMKRIGFDNNLYIIFRHHDSNHPHCHILATRNRFDGTVVSDSNNYKRSEQIVRDLENKYNLQKAKSSKQSKLKAPNRDELEMIQRTKRPSKKLILQHKVREAIRQSATMQEFINHLEKQNINVLFNKASTGRVSGITYQIPGFKIRGQALGNQFKFGSIIKQINYEQSRDGQAISQANDRTRARYGRTEKTGYGRDQKSHHRIDGSDAERRKKSIPGDQLSAEASSRNHRAKENCGHGRAAPENKEVDMDRRHVNNILSRLAGMLDPDVKQEKPDKQQKRKRNKGLSR